VHDEPMQPSTSERSPTKVSPIDAARLSFEVEPVVASPSRARALDAAELVWCRTLMIPSVRAIAVAARCAPSNVIRSRRLVDLYAEVIAREWALLDAGWFSAHPKARAMFFRRHVFELHARDPVLQRLPGLVLSSLAAASPAAPFPPRLALVWFAVGAFAADGSIALSA